MVTLDKTRVLDHETVFFYASPMHYRLCYVMDQAGIPHMEMPAHRIQDNPKFENIPIPQTAISYWGEMSDLVCVMISKIDPEYMEEKMKEIVFDDDLLVIEMKKRKKESEL